MIDDHGRLTDIYAAPAKRCCYIVVAAARGKWVGEKGDPTMHINLHRMVRQALGLSDPHDEGMLAGPSEAAVQALATPEPVVSLFGGDVAVLCPDLVHEAQRGLSRRD
jgi:hypothetical protein